jgi:hypothetical protein
LRFPVLPGVRGSLSLAIALNLALAGQWAVRVGQALAAATPFFDFPALYTGWRLAVARSAGLYDFGAQGQLQRTILGVDAYAGGVLPFVHPPHAALLLAPLGWLSLRGAFLLWTAIQLGLLGGLAWQIQRLFAPRPRTVRLLAISVALAFPPLAITVWFGQVSLLVLVGFTGLALALRDRRPRPWAAAFALLLISIKPQLLVFPLLAVALAGGGAALRRFGVLMLALGGLAAAVLGPGVWPGFFRATARLLSWSSEEGLPVATMHNLRGLLTAFLGEGSRAAITTASAVSLGVALAAFLVLGRRLRDRPLLLLAVASGVGAFFSLHLFVQDDLVYLLAVGLAGDHLARGSRAMPVAAALAAVPVLYQLAMPAGFTALLPLLVLAALALALRAGRPPTDPAPC